MTVRAYKLGSLGQDDLTGIKSLVATCAAATPNYMTFEYPVGTDYQVPAGKTFYVTKMYISAGVTYNENSVIQIGYGDIGTADATSGPTNLVILTGRYEHTAGVSGKDEFDVIIPIPAEKYPCLKSIYVSASVTVYGIEV